MSVPASSVATQLAAGGYSPLPIPWGQKGPRVPGWPKYLLTTERAEPDFGERSNIGILAKETPFADIDVTDAALSAKIEAEALQRWPGALVRVGQAPKVAIILRCEEPFSKLRTEKYDLPNGATGQVEIMAEGQQVVAFGQHPSGVNYVWKDRSPLQVRRNDLPVVTREGAKDFLDWCERRLANAAGVTLPEQPREYDGGNLGQVYDFSKAKQSYGFQFDTGAGSDFGERTLDEARELLSFIAADDRKVWIDVGMALKAEFGDAALGLWDSWSATGCDYKSWEPEKKWRGFNGSGVTFSTIAVLAQRAGADLSAIASRHKVKNNGPAAVTAKTPPLAEAESSQLAPTPFKLRDPATIPPRRWLFDKRLISGFVSLTVSPGGLGKSSLSTVEQLAMCSGKPLLGVAPPRALNIWAWNGEDPADELERRMTAACLHYGLRPEEVEGRLWVDSGRSLPIKLATQAGTGTVIARPVVEALVEAIKARSIDVMIIDPFVTIHEVSENDNAAINAVADLWREVAHRTGCAVELIHHAKKGSRAAGAEFGIDQARGASALVDAVRSARFLTPMTDDEAARAGLDSPKGYFQVVDGKANLAPPVDRAVWRKMEGIALGNGAGLYPEGDFVGVATAWEMPDAFDGLTSMDLDKVLAAMRGGEWAKSNQAANWLGVLVARTLDLGDVGSNRKDERTPAQSAVRGRVNSMIKTWLRNGEIVEEARHSARDGREKPFLVPARKEAA